jgi:hypothetical protein
MKKKKLFLISQFGIVGGSSNVVMTLFQQVNRHHNVFAPLKWTRATVDLFNFQHQ